MLCLVVDPGIRCCGVSVWDDGALQWAGLVVSPERSARGPAAWLAMAQAVQNTYPLAVDRLVVELQQVYPGGYGPPPDDLMQLTGVVGALTGLYEGRCGAVEGFFPRQWSQVKKEIRLERLHEPGVLSDEEWSRVEDCPAALRHNVEDSIAFGRWYVERLGERSAKVSTGEAA